MTTFSLKGSVSHVKRKRDPKSLFQGDSQRTIAAVLHVSRNTVAKVVQTYHEHPMEACGLNRLDSEADKED